MGMLLLIITLHFVGVKEVQTPMMEQKNVFLICFLYCCVMVTSVFFVLPKKERHTREKIMWRIVIVSVFVLTIFAKICLA